ncbi:hypothetical protein MTR67_018548 [Solanum verrucosum]|uniref:Uncharacterized protein n=1 Tax=Solanum verrucosum TaxID=315347 RepID=A0AAF0TTU5_SOLVR|nr:hypothetical protein MTR67_018548 [Solanum verrucosum]
MKNFRSCRCNPRLPPTDHGVTHGPFWWSFDGHLQPFP